MKIKQFLAMVSILAFMGLGCSKSDSGSSDGSGGSTSTPAASYTVSVTVSGIGTGNTWSQKLVLQNNGADDLTIDNDGTYSFATKVTSTYAVTVKTHPIGVSAGGYFCTVSNGSGTASSDVTVSVSCSTNPGIISTTPADGDTNVKTCDNLQTNTNCKAQVKIVFNESMNTSVEPTLTFYDYSYSGTNSSNESSYQIPHNTNSTQVVTWSTTNVTNDTATVDISWIRFPENTKLKLVVSNAQDSSNNTMQTHSGIMFTTETENTTTGMHGRNTGAFTATGLVGSIYVVDDTDTTTNPHPNYTDYSTWRWTKCQIGLETSSTCSTGSPTTVNWYNAIDACSVLNTAGGKGGRTTWRLPTYKEIYSISVNGSGGAVLKYLNTAYFPEGNNAVIFPRTATTGSYMSASGSSNLGYSFDLGLTYGDNEYSGKDGTATPYYCVSDK